MNQLGKIFFLIPAFSLAAVSFAQTSVEVVILPTLSSEEKVSAPIPVTSGIETGNTNHRRPPKGLSFWDKKSGTWKLIKKNQ